MTFTMSLAACGSGANEQKTQPDSETGTEVSNIQAEVVTDDEEGSDKSSEETTPIAAEDNDAEPATSGKDTLVIYFSATGTTRGVAERIAEAEDADIYEILAAEPYSDADLDWNDSNSRTTKEQNDSSSRPKIGSETIDLSGYSVVYIGYPIWWGEEPRIMDTFVESYDFDGITVIPFCTSGGSGIGGSGKKLADNAESGNWLEGERLQSSISDSDLQRWIDSYK